LISAIFESTKNPKVAGYGQNKSKMIFLKGGVDGFSYFFLLIFSYFSFYAG
jgi:hypothetical protein